MQRLREVDAHHPRLAWFDAELERGRKADLRIAEGRKLLREGKAERAESIAREVLAESPQNGAARLLMSQAAQARPLEDTAGMVLGPAFQKPVTLEFRDAPLRQVFEALSRSADVNFVFDKDVRSDARITVFLRNVTLDEAMRVILSTQQLDRKLLNENSVLVFPNNAAKQREHQELVTRTLYLTNADVKVVQAMVRTIAKVRDIHIDERLNLLIVRDTPEVVRLVEKLVASVDLPEPEVMLDVEVMELATDKVESLGLQWPTEARLGISDAAGSTAGTGPVYVGGKNPINFRASIANPVILATLTGTASNSNLLANPKIRVRNRDKAKVVIGEKVPVFTTTSNLSVGGNAVAASVSYLDVGLKLEVEPSVQLGQRRHHQDEPGGQQPAGPGDRPGRLHRLHDRHPPEHHLAAPERRRDPGAGRPDQRRGPRQFGRHPGPVDAAHPGQAVRRAGHQPQQDRGGDADHPAHRAQPGPARCHADPRAGRYRRLARRHQQHDPAGRPLGRRPRRRADRQPAGRALAERGRRAGPGRSPERGAAEVRRDALGPGRRHGVRQPEERERLHHQADLAYDASRLQPSPGPAGVAPGTMSVELPPRGGRVVMLRALPAANGQVLNIELSNLVATGPNGEQAPVRVDGAGLLTVEMPR